MELFDFSKCLIGERLKSEVPIYNVLPKLGQIIEEAGAKLGKEYRQVQPHVWVHKTAEVSDRAILCPPLIVCAGAQIRPNAYLRGAVIVGENTVVGACCEVKNSILFNGAKVPHLSYVGDSILGHNAHFGAGVIAANLRLDGGNVSTSLNGKREKTGLRKFGSLVGDGAQVGCGCVLCPGTVIKSGEFVLPLTCVCGKRKSNFGGNI